MFPSPCSVPCQMVRSTGKAWIRIRGRPVVPRPSYASAVVTRRAYGGGTEFARATHGHLPLGFQWDEWWDRKWKGFDKRPLRWKNKGWRMAKLVEGFKDGRP